MNTNTKNAAAVVENNAAAKNTKNTKNAAKTGTAKENINAVPFVVDADFINAAEIKTDAVQEFPPLSAVDVVALSAAWIKEYGTISSIRDKYAELVAKYGKDNFAAVLKNAKTIRATEIKNAAELLNTDVFTFNGILSAVFAAVAKSAGYVELCKFARREYAGTDAERAAAVIRDYFTNVDDNGAPLRKVSYINAAGTEIYTTFERVNTTYNNAVAILKKSLDNMAKSATNAATSKNGNDNAAAVRANVRAVSRIIAVYAAAVDENGRATFGERRDTSKDERTKKNAAAVLGMSLPVGVVPLTTWNAAANGNDDAAAAVEDAKNAAKDAAAAAGHAAAVK